MVPVPVEGELLVVDVPAVTVTVVVDTADVVLEGLALVQAKREISVSTSKITITLFRYLCSNIPAPPDYGITSA